MEANEVWDKPPIFSSLVFDLAFLTQTIYLILGPSDSIAASSRMRVMERECSWHSKPIQPRSSRQPGG